MLVVLLFIAAPIHIDVFVPLCDSALIACGRGAAGDPHSLDGNLYWGAAFGAEHFLTHAEGWRLVSRKDAPSPGVLRETVVERSGVSVRLIAYDGTEIDRALSDFLIAAGGETSADLVVWAGHDRLMDVAPPNLPTAKRRGQPVAVLACSSAIYFGPILERIGAKPVALTKTFMAPEAYLLEAMATAVAAHGVLASEAIRDALISAYARYQHLSVKAASTVFARL